MGFNNKRIKIDFVMLSCKLFSLSVLCFRWREMISRYSRCLGVMSFVIILLSVPIGCKTHGSKAAKQKKAIEKRFEEKQKKQMAAYENAKERHRKIQSAGGKQLLSESDRHTKSLDKRQGKRKRFFLWRWLFKDDNDQPSCRK